MLDRRRAGLRNWRGRTRIRLDGIANPVLRIAVFLLIAAALAAVFFSA